MRRVAPLKTLLIALAAVLTLGMTLAYAVQPDEMLSDRALEARARALSQQLRCMVCQNQSIDDSDAPLARDLRILVRERLTAGDSDQEVIGFLTSRYGDFVLLKPPFIWSTTLLWLTPPGILLFGAIALFAVARRRLAVSHQDLEAAEPALSPAEQIRLSKLMEGHD